MVAQMPNNDSTEFRVADVTEAVQLLTRLPVKHRGTHRGAAAAWAYPIAGLAVGLIASLFAVWTSPLPDAISAGLVLIALTIMTGALHEDGLADTLDGLWGGHTAERRLEIMKDSQIGSFGTLALIASFGLRWAALTEIAANGSLWLALLIVPTISRAPMVAVMHILPNARANGLSRLTGRPERSATLLALAIAFGVGVLGLGLGAILAALLLCAVTAVVIFIAKTKIRGQTGDILGATQQISEIALLIYLAS